MYERFFGFDEAPFRLTPDPRYLFLSAKHKETLGHLVYGLEDGAGFVAITGEIGAGKTTLVRSFLSDPPPKTQYAYILNPVLSGVELLQEINHELGLRETGTQRDLTVALNAHLLREKKAGNQVVLVIDEAQALDGTVLEQLRMLSNFETETAKLIQIVLVGQPELRDLLARPDLEQLDQRISVRWHLRPLDRAETAAYIAHRLTTASAGRERRIFTRAALRRIYGYTSGVPRRINVLCHRALLVAYAADSTTVTGSIIGRAIREIENPRQAAHGSQRAPLGRPALAASLLVAALVGGLAAWWSLYPGRGNVAEVVRALDALGGRPAPAAAVAKAGGSVADSGPDGAIFVPVRSDGPRVAPYPLLVPGAPVQVPVRADGPKVAAYPLLVSGAAPYSRDTVEDPAGPPIVALAALPRGDVGGSDIDLVAAATPVRSVPGAMEVASEAEFPSRPVPPPETPLLASAGVRPPAAAPGMPSAAEPLVAVAAIDSSATAADREPQAARAPTVQAPEPPAAGLGSPVSWNDRAALGDALRQTTPGASAYEAVEGLVEVWGGEPLSASEAAMHPLDLPGIAQQRGLEYLQFRGNLNVLRVLDLPIIVELDPGEGAPVQFALVDQIDVESVHARIGQNKLRMSHRLFSEIWFGQGHLLWYDIDNLGRLLTVGSTGQRVERLQERLRVAGFDVGAGGAQFDAKTEEAVMQLQRTVHLAVDGKAGPMTMIALYGLAAPQLVPHLETSDFEAIDLASRGVLP